MAKGGRREGAGRKKGSVNKCTAEIKALIQKRGPELVEGLFEIRDAADAPYAAKIAATKELLDRGYGKAEQAVAVTGEEGEGPVKIEFSWASEK